MKKKTKLPARENHPAGLRWNFIRSGRECKSNPDGSRLKKRVCAGFAFSSIMLLFGIQSRICCHTDE
jgi:hypothetical protein